VFIAYSRVDHSRVKPIAERLVSLGYSVSWDIKQDAKGQTLIDEIERELDDARVVLAAWSHNGRNSTSLQAQCARAFDAGKLLQLRLDSAEAPAPFDALPAAAINGERGEWGLLEDALQRLARGGPAPAPSEKVPMPGLLAAPPQVGAPKLLTLALALALAAFFAAISGALAGAMTPDQLQFALTGIVGIGAVVAAISAQRFATVRRAGG
jgi:hypothetical protein